MTREPEWQQGQPVPDGWAVIARLGRLWAEVPVSERATKADWTRDVPKPSDYRWPSFNRITLEPECEIAVPTDAISEWRGGKWLPCHADVYDGSKRCPRHGGSRKARATTRLAIADLQRENEELRRQVQMLTTARELTGSIDMRTPEWYAARNAADLLADSDASAR